MQNFSAVRAVWFSPTGSTKTITEYVAKSLAEMLGVPMKSSSYTLPKDREKTLFLPSELVVWGTPTYAGRIPNKTLDFVRAALTNDDFSGNVMIPIAVYGNRSFDNCLAELGGLMKKGGHFPIAGIAMPTRHTFSKTLGAGRPDAADFATLDEFCTKIRNKIMTIDIAPAKFPGEEEPEKYYVPKRLDGEPANFLKAKAQVHVDKCTGCGTCTEVCPMGSIKFDVSKETPVFEGICIKCQACIRHCKNGALYFDDPDFLSHVAMLEANFASPLKKPELFL